MADNLATISTKALATVIGKLPDLGPVNAALRHTLGL
jgi:hypothetical protein